MAKYLLGVDNGLTVTKVALFDLEGREVQVASRKRDAVYPHPGWTELDMNALWQCTVEAIREAIAASGVRPEQIIGIGNTAHGNGLYLLDRHGNPLRAGILSLDTRAGNLVNTCQAQGISDQVWRETLQAPWPGQPPDTWRTVVVLSIVVSCLRATAKFIVTALPAFSMLRPSESVGPGSAQSPYRLTTVPSERNCAFAE
jgi:FGGY family of carbohydrate kinases, N-terminal domain